jgi:hypothetical protein
MQLLCPFCGSSHVQLHPVVHAAGTQHMHLNHSGVVDGRFMQGASHGTQYSALAQHCAPPAPPSPMPFLIAYGLGGMLSYQAFTNYGGIQWKWVFSGALVVAIGWGLMKAWHHAANEYGLEKQRWQNTRFCHGCGQSHMLT